MPVTGDVLSFLEDSKRESFLTNVFRRSKYGKADYGKIIVIVAD
jgi:hypothetical protein